MTTYPADAACATLPITPDRDPFFPDTHRPDPWAEARAICADCPVIDACLTGAIDRREPHGLWGGLTPAERDRMTRRQQRAKRKGRPPGLREINHGTAGGAVAHRRRGLPVCDPCHAAERAYRTGRRRAAAERAS